jgi:hyperosmotically inducible protein
MKTISAKVLLSQILLLGCMTPMWAQQDSSSSQGVRADNTKVNQRDQDQSVPTAGQQKNSTSDREIAQQIRRNIVKDKSLSTYAHNVKVVVQNGSVTLKGPVRNEDEKKAIESKAAEITGADKVTNEIEVASK